MKIIWLVASVVFMFMGGYFWIVKGQIDYAALYLALCAINHSVYHNTK